MKGVLGKKVGMTQVFNDQGRSIPVSIIEIPANQVTEVLTKAKHGYDALQLGVFDRPERTVTKPMLGHFKKANSAPKYFIREIRNMVGFERGQTIDGSIFKVGDLVDVQGVSKGHGFQGNIKRYGQHIGPKSHGGGGGSQPVRQVGSLGDMVSNRVFKGMTMPGHMGVDKVTIQNLEIIKFDQKNNYLLVKGSIPGPRKGFVVVSEAIKGLPSRTPMQLVNVTDTILKNELLEEAKKAGASVNTDMTIEAMRDAIKAALEAKEAETKARLAKEAAEKILVEEEKVKHAAEEAHRHAEELKNSGTEEQVKEAEEKARALDHQVEVLEEKEHQAQSVVKQTEAEAKTAEAKADALNIQEEPATEDETSPKPQAGGNK